MVAKKSEPYFFIPSKGGDMTREEAIQLVNSSTKNQNLIKHMLAVESAMRRIAAEFGEDEELWGLAGLLHDIDYEETLSDFSRHGKFGAEKLSRYKVDERIIKAIKSHPCHPDFPPESKLDWALYAVDPLTGLIVAATLMHPTRKIKNIDVDFVLRRFKEKRFAAGANREQIMACEKIGIELRRFIELTLEGMQSIAQELGL